MRMISSPGQATQCDGPWVIVAGMELPFCEWYRSGSQMAYHSIFHFFCDKKKRLCNLLANMNKVVWILILLSTQAMAQKLIIREPVNFLALGDSYTIGESVSVANRWPVQLVDSLQKHGIDCLEPRIIAATGWRTDNLKIAIGKAKFREKYNLVSLLIGVNNFYQGKTAEHYASEFESLLITAIQLAGGKANQVFVLSIPDYGFTPFGKNDQQRISNGIECVQRHQ